MKPMKERESEVMGIPSLEDFHDGEEVTCTIIACMKCIRNWYSHSEGVGTNSKVDDVIYGGSVS